MTRTPSPSPALATLLLAGLAVGIPATARAATVSGWELLFDGDGDASFTAGTASTSSPEITDAHRTSPAANFPAVTLADGESIVLTGTVSFSVPLANGQFRWGLFDGDNPVTAGDGVGYQGVFAEAPTPGGNAYISETDGSSSPHPFATAGSADIGNMSDPGVTPTAGTPLSFTLTLTRSDGGLDISANITDGGAYGSSISFPGWPPITPSFTYDSVAFLTAGSFVEPMTATYSNIDVSVVPEPSSAVAFGVFGALALLRRRRS